MSIPTEPRSEYPSTYIVQDRSNQEELARLTIQDHMMSIAMGGMLPEQPDPTIFKQVLDVGCGTGGWLIDTAQTYPTISLLVGVDISRRMVEYAKAQAEAVQVSNRVEFRVMDALRILDFPANTFDLINQRMGTSYLRTWDWRKLLQEYRRVAQPGGIIRITESDMTVESSSQALTRLFELALDAFYQAGHFFSPESKGVADDLADLLERAGLDSVQTHTYTLEYYAETLFTEDIKRLFRTILPFLQKWLRVPNDYEILYQQMLYDIQHPDFVARARAITAWGQKPPE